MFQFENNFQFTSWGLVVVIVVVVCFFSVLYNIWNVLSFPFYYLMLSCGTFSIHFFRNLFVVYIIEKPLKLPKIKWMARRCELVWICMFIYMRHTQCKHEWMLNWTLNTGTTKSYTKKFKSITFILYISDSML